MKTAVQCFSIICILAFSPSAYSKGPKYTDPEHADADFAFQGEYTGTILTDNGEHKFGVQVIAMGHGKFHAVAYAGGLPGAGWDGSKKVESDGSAGDGLVTFSTDHATATIKGDTLTIVAEDGRELGSFKRVLRKSPTLGKKAPKGATLLFDGSTVEHWEGGRKDDQNRLMAGTTSKDLFGDHSVHIEFLLPYQPEDRGQGRGNSGIYLQGRYEVQMLDSFGLEGKSNECGGIYTVRDPDINMCFPPLTWQTYDIDFTAARYDSKGTLTSPPRMTVRHNGQVVHDNVALPNDKPTRAAPRKAGADAGPIFLQDHGCPVKYRNVWVATPETQDER